MAIFVLVIAAISAESATRLIAQGDPWEPWDRITKNKQPCKGGTEKYQASIAVSFVSSLQDSELCLMIFLGLPRVTLGYESCRAFSAYCGNH